MTRKGTARGSTLRFKPPRVPKPYREQREDLLRQIERHEAMMKTHYRAMLDTAERLAVLNEGAPSP